MLAPVKLIAPAVNPPLEFLDTMEFVDNAHLGVYSGVFEGLTTGYEASGAVILSNCRPGASDIAAATPEVVETPTFEPVYLAAAPANASCTINVRLHLDFIKDSIFELDKDIYFGGEIVNLEIYWAPLSDIMFQATAATNPVAGAALYVPTGASSVCSLSLQLAVEADAANIAYVQGLVQEGKYNVAVPWLQPWNLTIQGTQSHQFAMPIGPSVGSKLKKIYWSAYTQNAVANYRWYHSNETPLTGVPGFRIANYYTAIDNDNLQGGALINCANYDDYEMQRRTLRGSAICSDNEHYYNWVHVEDFTLNTPQASRPITVNGLYEDEMWVGYDLIKDTSYRVNATTGFGGTNATGPVANVDTANPTLAGSIYNINHQMYAIALRHLNIGPQGAKFIWSKQD
jgi:hypothetical protein